jgi:hypothetical protein
LPQDSSKVLRISFLALPPLLLTTAVRSCFGIVASPADRRACMDPRPGPILLERLGFAAQDRGFCGQIGRVGRLVPKCSRSHSDLKKILLMNRLTIDLRHVKSKSAVERTWFPAAPAGPAAGSDQGTLPAEAQGAPTDDLPRAGGCGSLLREQSLAAPASDPLSGPGGADTASPGR